MQYQVVPEVLQRHTKMYLGAVGILYQRVFLLYNVDYLCRVQRLHRLSFLGFPKVQADDFCKVLLVHEGGVKFLKALHLFVAEPIGEVLDVEFVHYLCKELVVVYLALVVDVFAARYGDTDVSAASCSVGERVGVIGCCYEGSKTDAVLLCLAVDDTSVDLTLRQCLFQRRMLRGTYGIKLVEVDEEVVG